MTRKILIMGLPGAGKTTLARVLAPRLNAVHFNADDVRREINRESVPHRPFVSVSVSICGSGASVSASGSDHRKALIALLQNIEMHHREILRWHKQRCARTREILDEHAIYYVKGDL